jgi:hypothetical protein
MKKSEVKSQQPVGEMLEAPISLTPEQLEAVAAGMAVGYYKPKPIVVGGGTGGGATTGFAPPIKYGRQPISLF